MKERREALVVGINRYPLLRDGTTKKPQHLEKPAADAEAVAQIIEKYGNFTVRRLPEVYSPEGKRGVDPNPPSQNLVQVPDLEAAIAQLFNPPGRIKPDTALLFFAGHGLRKEQGGVTEGFLATSDVNPDKGKWGVSLRWLRELLQKSPVQQQIIWLDCCHSGELLNILDEANPGKEGKAVDRCLIAACRGFEVSREQLQGEHGILTAALLQGLNPNADVDGWVSNNKLADFINKKMSAELQRPVFHNSGGAIILTDRTHGAQRQVDSKLKGKCPYKSLNYFTQEDAVFFYGRTELTDILIDRVRRENFTAVLGASGSGKSSVLRAGLLYQLKRGQKLSGSDRWKYYDPFTPGEHPLQSFKKATGTDAQHFKQYIATLKTERVVLVVDQFEECFTMCQDKQEREQFFACLLQAVEQTNNKLRLVLGMRADFLGKCAEYAQLANKIDRHLVTVKPMTRQEIEEAIAKPGELVGLKVEQALVTKMTDDVVGSPGSLPLLQYTLTELWEQAQKSPNRNRLTLECYHLLGGIEKTLPKRANQVYNSLQDEEKLVAKRIFLELTQLGETSDRRRRVRKEDLVNQRHSLELLDRTIEQLVKAKLIVTTNESQSVNGKPGVILDIVHEALIRHWQELRQWVADNQVALEIERKIEARAKDWERNGKTEDLGLLLQGATLIEAETYLNDYGNLGLLDGIAQEYIEVSQKVRDRLIQKELERKQRELKAVKTRNRILVGSLGVVSAVAVGAFFLWRDAERQKTIARLGESAAVASNLVSVTPVEGLMRAIQATGESQSSLRQVLNPVQSSLLDAIDVARERNILRGHQGIVSSVALGPDGQRIVSGGADGTVRLWDSSGKAIGSPIKAHQGIVSSVALGPDGQRIVSGGEDGTVRLWDSSGKAIGSPLLGHQGSVISVALSPDGQRIVSGGADGTVRLWDSSGKAIGSPIKAHQGIVSSVALSPDGQRIVSGGADGTVRLWDSSGKAIGSPLLGHQGIVSSVALSPDGQRIVSGGEDGTVRLWDSSGKAIGSPLLGHQGIVFSVALSPDGQRIVSGGADGTVRLWDSSGKAIGSPIKAHQGIVSSVAFSADGQRIVSGGEDGTVRLWDSSGKAIGSPFLGHQGDVSSVALSPDGQRIVSGGADGTVRLWQGGTWERWLRMGCDRLLDHPVLVEPETNIDEESETIKFAQSARSTCQKLAWNPSENARFLVNQGRAIGQGGDFKGAMAKFQAARKLSPSITIPSEAEVGWWAAGGLVKNGEKLVKEGKVKEALAAYREAQTLKPTWKLPSESWNTLCRYGSLHGQAAEVMKACENAVTVAPKNGEFRDSRGIARAMTGNTAGAIEDFQAFIKSTGSDEEKKQRQGWIDALKAGKNPFTQEEIKRLLPE
ncbi:nSTAND1 domain-containing NTPase [Microseira wollei]|uniref:Peptidase C14, caspase catalytic subunit p20 n=1 Tax=Microseira wollei NIES-4236 TaxID=2530354 RepID=A0AAV3X7X3_9CYAN|nr:caspase family protein [Microseira wollei]GET35472.1 peptidase C14, caspase catalytic subunit p20 [Microseira wollei NIES-4236]